MFESLKEKSPDTVLLPEEKKFPDKANLISLIVGIVGSILIFVGNFLPLADWTNRTSSTLIKAFPVFGWLFIALAVVSFIIW